MAKKKKNTVYTEESVPMEKASNELQASLGKEEEENKEKREEIQVTIETVYGQAEKSLPLVGYFPSGFDPLKGYTHGSQEQETQPKIRVFKNVKRSNRLQLVVSPNASQVDFIGTNYAGEGAAPQICTFALGVLDKQNQTLKIVPIEANKIFRLEPRVGKSDALEPSDGVKEEMTAEEKADRLLIFATKQTIQKERKRKILGQNQNPEALEDLDRKVGAIKINKEALEVAATTSTNDRNIPPHDLSATIPQMAYPLNKIIFSGEWNYLNDIVELSRAGKEVAPDAYPIFVCNRVHKIEEIKDEELKESLAGIFSYITHLIKFKDKHSMDGFSSARNHKIPSILFQKFSTMFAISDSKRLPDDKKDLLISYVLVLTLFADNFRTNISDIARDLRMTAGALRPLYEHLGCKLVREGNILLATLPAPLQFRTLRAKRRRN